jgi:2-polyprenyl-3-methyl-5-hydroxy-6-metoxy-1,4-benzoquinol methylase
VAPAGFRRQMSAPEERSDEEVLDAWRVNAANWTEVVRERKIESRNLVTDQAILDAVTARNPLSVLDLGCGEGWLSRVLAERGIACTGVDAIPALIESAKSLGGGDFRVASFEEVSTKGLDVIVDVVVANFSLIGGEAVDAVIRHVRHLLNPRGFFIVQTVHPSFAEVVPYREGWVEGSWAGCPDGFTKPAPWYFRTIETWVKTVRESGLELVELKEPLHPTNGRPASLILVARRD